MFAIDTSDIPSITNYKSALERWHKTKPWRGHADDAERPLEKRSKRHMTIHLKDNGDVAFRLYSTNVVIYHPDNSITLDPYTSRSTDAFANSLLPSGMGVNFNHPQFMLVWIGHYCWDDDTRVYNIPCSGARFAVDDSGQWQPVTPCVPFSLFKVNRKRVNKIMKDTGFERFIAWYEAAVTMGKEFDLDRWGLSPSSAIDALADRDRWTDLANYIAAVGPNKVRDKLILQCGGLDTTTYDHVDYKLLNSITRSHQRWQYV